MSRETLRLLAEGRAYRRLWAAQAISLCGDWFTLIALAVLVSRDTRGSGLAVAGLVLAQILPGVVVGPFAGVLADRLDRRRLLVASDLVRCGLVLLMIPAARTGHLGPVYSLALLHFTVSTVFEPARSALLPRLVEPRQLVAAVTLSTVTWSVMAAAGGVVGGTALALVGVTGAFLIDALTFAASAAFIAAIPVPPAPPAAVAPPPSPPRFRDGLRYGAAHPTTGAVLFVKAINGVAIADTFIVIYGTRIFPLGPNGGRSVGLLWACFGVGAMLGPLLLNAANDGSVRRMRRLIVAGCAFLSGGLFLLGAAPSLLAAGAAVVVRGMGGSANWTYSTIILQKSVPDPLLGRVFALDLANAFVAAMVFSLLWGYTMDHAGVRTAVFAAAAVSLLPLLAWTLALGWMDRRESSVGSVNRS
jgi:MFS family permease